MEKDTTAAGLVSVDEVLAVTDAMSSIFAQGLESLPAKLAGETEPAIVREVLKNEVRRVRQSVTEAFERKAANQTFDPNEV